MPGPRIAEGERVALRTVEREDAAFIQRARVDPALRIPLGNPVGNREQVEEMFDDDGADRFLVCLDADDAGRGSPGDAGPSAPDESDVRRIGAISVEDADWKRPDLGYWLVPEVHGRGYGTEAVSLVVDYVFRTYDHPAVGAIVYAFNDASRGLLESLGFEEEGRIRRERFIDGEYVDTVQYGLLREEWREH